MGKRGKSKALKRVAVSKAVPIHDKKHKTWILRPSPGTHPARKCVPLGVVLREVLGLTESARENRRLLTARKVQVDGRVRAGGKFPVGLMDVLSIPDGELYYRIVVGMKGRLVPAEITEKESHEKLLKVVGKRTGRGGKIMLRFHDGRNAPGDNNVRVGDTVRFSLKDKKIAELLKFGVDSSCIITDGKHAGEKAVVLKLFPSKGERPPEALVKTEESEVRTLAKYLFVTGE